MKRLATPSLIVFLFILAFSSCKKEVTSDYKLSYGDSVLYLKNQPGDHIIYPTEHRAGTYSAFPEGLEINASTGAINVSKSETGLRYRVTHVSAEGKETSTMIVVSGINYTDKYYNLSLGDTIAPPVYNASDNQPFPLVGSIFDEGNEANGSGCSVATVNGQINLAETIRNGWLGNPPSNDAKREIDIVYRLNDRSGKAVNKVRVKLYWYSSMITVAPDLLQTLRERDEAGVFLKNQPIMNPGGISTARNIAAAKPRPPCIIIIAN